MQKSLQKEIWFFIFLLLTFAITSSQEKIDINTASLKDLQKITGIGPVLAKRIIQARPFFSLEDLKKVEGIGEKMLQKIKEQGLAYVKNPPFLNNNEEEDMLKNIKNTVIINEFLPNPEGPDEKNEWVELYNNSDFEIDLTGWILKDGEGKINEYKFKEIKIQPRSFLVLKREKTKIIMNNDKDALFLFDSKGNLIDSATYLKAELGKSYNRTPTGWKWGSFPTPGSENIEEEKKEDGNQDKKNPKENYNIINPSNPWILFCVALAISFFLAIITLIINSKINYKNVRT